MLLSFVQRLVMQQGKQLTASCPPNELLPHRGLYHLAVKFSLVGRLARLPRGRRHDATGAKSKDTRFYGCNIPGREASAAIPRKMVTYTEEGSAM